MYHMYYMYFLYYMYYIYIQYAKEQLHPSLPTSAFFFSKGLSQSAPLFGAAFRLRGVLGSHPKGMVIRAQRVS